MIEAVTGAEPRAHAGNTREYVDATTTELHAGRRIGATSLAINVLAAINSANLVGVSVPESSSPTPTSTSSRTSSVR